MSVMKIGSPKKDTLKKICETKKKYGNHPEELHGHDVNHGSCPSVDRLQKWE